LKPGSQDSLTITSWALGRRYATPNGKGATVTGLVNPAPSKPANLIDSTGKYFERSKPQYEAYASTSFVVATAHGISNAGTGDQTAAINALLLSSVETPVFFPAGIYLVESTVFIPGKQYENLREDSISNQSTSRLNDCWRRMVSGNVS
jgi:glucan 1,3-beta-glucosidase